MMVEAAYVTSSRRKNFIFKIIINYYSLVHDNLPRAIYVPSDNHRWLFSRLFDHLSFGLLNHRLWLPLYINNLKSSYPDCDSFIPYHHLIGQLNSLVAPFLGGKGDHCLGFVDLHITYTTEL